MLLAAAARLLMNIKRKGLLLLDAAISAIILGIAAMSFVMLYSSQFALLSAGKDGKTAMQYAEVDAEILKTLSYQDIKDDDILGEALLHQERGQLLSVPDADGWQDEIIYGEEHHIASNDSDYTVATVNIYRDGDTLPRATLKVPLSSEDNR